MDPQIQAALQALDNTQTLNNNALTATNQQAFQQAVAEFNANYGNQQASTYGYNTGTTEQSIQYPGVGAPTLNAQQQIGTIGYIPGYTNTYGSNQSSSEMSDLYNQANQSASQTGIYAAPGQSQFQPGTFVRADPSTYNTAQWGNTLLYYVTPSGQFTAVTPDQAKAMGWNGNIAQTDVVSEQQAQTLQQAPPSQLPQQTLQSLGTYSNLNAQAQNQALQQSNATGMYSQPAQIQAPGFDMNGGSFYSLPQTTQMQYYLANGSNWNAAMQAWVNNSNANIQQFDQQNGIRPGNQAGTPQETMNAQQQFFNQAMQQAGLTGYVQNPGTPQSPNSTQTGQETMAAQQQMFNQANQLGTEYGQYYSPAMPGQTGQAGVNTPNPGQITEQGREFNVNTASDLAKLAGTLTGPANYFQYLQALNGGNSILNNLYTGQAQSPGGQVGSTGGTQSLDNILGQLGLNSGSLTGGVLPSGSYSNSQLSPTVTNQSTGTGTSGSSSNQFNLPAPNQINPAAYNSMSPSGQQFVQGAYQAAGYNPQDLSWFMNAATPATNQAPTTGGTTSHFANPTSQSLFA